MKANEYECWTAPFLIENLDQAIANGDQKKCAEIAIKVIEKLFEKGIPIKYLSSLRAVVTDPSHFIPRPKRVNLIGRVDQIVLEQFGQEMARRLHFDATNFSKSNFKNSDSVFSLKGVEADFK